MPLTDYHLFAIPCSVKEAEIGIGFSKLENELGGGFYSSLLFGSENGERRWALTLPSLTDTDMDSRTVTGINGETLSYASYLWDLYCEQQSQGTPFAYQCPRTRNYYLVRFANPELTFSRMLTKLYSTGIELKQWRISGETVFSPGNVEQTVGSYAGDGYLGGFVGWSDESETTGSLIGTGDVAQIVVGDYAATQFNLTTNDGYVNGGGSTVVKEAILLMKMREATFSNTAGILSGSAAPNNVFLVGASGTTKFTDLGFGGAYTYKLNGVAYAENDQQAPMNAWGIVHARHTTGITLSAIQFGKDRDFIGRFAEVDIAYAIVATSLFPVSTVREIMEFLSILKAKLEA